MDKVVEAVEKAKKEWDEAYSRTQEHIKAIEEYGKSREEKNSLPRLNGLAQDGLALLSSLQFKLDLLAPQLPSDHEVQSATALLHSWKSQSQKYNSSLSLSRHVNKLYRLFGCSEKMEEMGNENSENYIEFFNLNCLKIIELSSQLSENRCIEWKITFYFIFLNLCASN